MTKHMGRFAALLVLALALAACSTTQPTPASKPAAAPAAAQTVAAPQTPAPNDIKADLLAGFKPPAPFVAQPTQPTADGAPALSMPTVANSYGQVQGWDVVSRQVTLLVYVKKGYKLAPTKVTFFVGTPDSDVGDDLDAQRDPNRDTADGEAYTATFDSGTSQTILAVQANAEYQGGASYGGTVGFLHGDLPAAYQK